MCQRMMQDAHNSGHPDRNEIARCCALASTDYENAAMWAVKAATA